MAEEGENEAASGGGSGDVLAAQIAMNASGISEEAREYLRKQCRLADLQIDTLEKKDEFELSHLRFRRFSDYARFVLEISIGLVVLLIICGLGTMVWSAAQDHDLVVDAFSVPPDIAQTGLTGTALANRVLDRVGVMDHSAQSFAQDFSGYRNSNAQEVRVEIPDTGVSIGEINRYLQAWLGSETHVTGELMRTPTGLSITTRYGGQPGVTIEGKAADLNVLIQKSAETVFRGLQPLRYADYLSSHRRTAEGRAIARAETTKGDDAHRAQAYVSLGINDYWRGDSRHLAMDGARATHLDPNNGLAWFMLEAYYNNLDHEEGNLNVTKKMAQLAKAGHLGASDKKIVAALPAAYESIADNLLGDYSDAIENCKTTPVELANCSKLNLSVIYADAHDITTGRNLLSESPTRRDNGTLSLDVVYSRVQIDLVAGDYGDALSTSKTAEPLSTSPTDTLDRDVFLRPFEAEAMARMGDLAGARKIAAATPDECDTCIRARGRVEMIARNWSGAAHWFSLVSARMPDIPLADNDWGQMLMAKGDLDGAIAKFESANKKGPHFADPLEMWGEALIAKSRSDLALAKFEEADKYAPKWGRLHMKWGEALLWSGDKSGAQKQFAIAGGLYLAPSEKTELSRVAGSHV